MITYLDCSHKDINVIRNIFLASLAETTTRLIAIIFYTDIHGHQMMKPTDFDSLTFPLPPP